MKDEEYTLRKSLKYEDERSLGNNIDDEYARAGIVDPKIFITTSRDPSSRLLQFAKV